MRNLLYLLVFSCFLFYSCKKEETPICDPCLNETEVTADFGMMGLSGTWLYFVDFTPDVAFLRGFITFRAFPQDPDATYTWYLGSETITGSQFQRDFSPTIATGENNIPITLVIRKTPNKECYPNDDGYDSIAKIIKLVDDRCEFLTNGDFKVLFDGKSDSSFVRIRNWDYRSPGYYTPDCDDGTVIIGFDRNSRSDTNWANTGSRAGFQLNSSLIFNRQGSTINGCYDGFFKVNPDNWKVNADYHVFRIDGSSDRYKFKGRKIN